MLVILIVEWCSSGSGINIAKEPSAFFFISILKLEAAGFCDTF